MGKLKKPNSTEDELYTMVPNRLIRSEKLEVFDKMVFIVIQSCNPAFPGYEAIQRWTGLSRERIWKSLRTLEQFNLITRYKKGRGIEYFTAWTSSPDEPIDALPVRFTNSTSSPDELQPVRQTNSKKIKEKEQIKKGISGLFCSGTLEERSGS